MPKRLLSLLLTFVMLFSLLPATAAAEEEEAVLYAVSFVCSPEDAAVTVFDGEETVPAEEDGSCSPKERTAIPLPVRASFPLRESPLTSVPSRMKCSSF